jgi:ATP-binding cassette subfamily B protein
MKSDLSGNEKWNKQLASLRRIPEIFQELWRVSNGFVIASLGLRLMLAAIPPLTLFISKLLIDAVVRVQHGHGEGWNHLWEIFAAEFAILALADLVGKIAGYTDGRLSDLFSHHLSVRILNHANALDLESLENPLFQDQLERARSQVAAQLAVLFSIAQFAQNTLGLIVLIGAVAIYAPWLVLLQVISLAPLALAELHFAAEVHQLYRKRTPMRRAMEYLMNLSTNTSSVKEVKAFGLGTHFADEYDGLGRELHDENAGLSRRRNITVGLLTVMGTAAYYAGYTYLVWQAGHGLITIGTLFFLGGSFQRSKWLMQEMSMTLSQTLDRTLHLGDVFEFFRVVPQIATSGRRFEVPRPIQKGFEFRNVSFAYSGTSTLALQQVSFSIRPGETVALVGENGAGKTTITKLLSRLYEPTDGAIYLDGIDLRDYDLESLQSSVSVVFQDFVRYEMTAARNIGYGDLRAISDIKRLLSAAEAGLALPIIARLPRKFDQILGKKFDGGVELSGGEWQKLALARACMRNAQLLILDEPSASLDARNEFLLIEHFAHLTANRMAVLISHRLPAVRMANKILVLDRGRLVEQGAHEDLLAKDGEYAALFRLQAAGYQEDFRFARTNDVL